MRSALDGEGVGHEEPRRPRSGDPHRGVWKDDECLERETSPSCALTIAPRTAIELLKGVLMCVIVSYVYYTVAARL